MTFSKEWDLCFKKNTNLSIWPWSDLVSYVMRYAKPNKPKFKVLELGCGAGANIPFFQSLNAEYFAIEGSKAIVQQLHKKFPTLKKNILVGDFTSNIPFSGHFDLIVDRSAVTHNTTDSIKRCLSFAYQKLDQNSKYIGIDWFSTLHSDYKKGVRVDGPYTKNGFKSGQFANVGNVHFSDKHHILKLFENFDVSVLEHKIIKMMIPTSKQLATWNIVAQKVS